MDFLTTTYMREFFLARRHPIRKSSYLTLIRPFTPYVWITFCISIALLLISVALISRLARQSALSDLFDMTRLIFGIMINESLPDRLLNLRTAGRPMAILMIMWVPLACFFGMGYQSTLLSALVKPIMEKPIDSFEDILQKDVKMFVFKPTVLPSLFRSTSKQVVREAYEKQALFINLYIYCIHI